MRNKQHLGKAKIPLTLGAVGVGGIFLFSYLTFVPNPVFADETQETEQRTLMNIKYMQQMSKQICDNTKENKSKRLIDKRDGKYYWVTKLRDGNCWMTQNLDYNGGGEENQNPSNWDGKTSSGHVSNTAAYYNPDKNTEAAGQYYYYTYINHYGKGCSSSNGPSGCSNLFSLRSIDNDNLELEHYRIGNYYSWFAATTTAGGDDQASDSICPANWQLPIGGSTESGSFTALMNAYGISGGTNVGIIYNEDNPLHFVYAGYLNRGTLNMAGYHGRYWSSSTSQFNFEYNVYPDYSDSAYSGSSVRCVVATNKPNLAGNGNTDETLKPDPAYPDDPDLNPKPDIPPAIGNALISVMVNPVITIDVVSGAYADIDFTKIAQSAITVDVGANQGYQVLISTTQPDLEPASAAAGNDINGDGEEDIIPMIVADQNLTAGTSAWGIKKKKSAVDSSALSSTEDADKYSPVGVGNKTECFFRSALPDKATLELTVGITVNPLLPGGTYSTKVVVTGAVL